jgi:N-acetylglucosaminyldiphosphoundecaprenol N-acetyl-beta-D-mannosaminyltransferase
MVVAMVDAADKQLFGHALYDRGRSAAYAAIIHRARRRAGGSALFCNVHMLVESLRFPELDRAMHAADWLLPDGMPLVRALRLLGDRRIERVAGMDAMPELCALCEREGLSIYVYGGDQVTLRQLEQRLLTLHPRLPIAGMASPPFAARSIDDESIDVAAIEASGAHLCFVALGCPKQELWIERHRGRTGAVLLGIGAALRTTAGQMAIAPGWVREAGLEWIYRLGQEPRRLWRRYARTNPVFVNRFVRELWSR